MYICFRLTVPKVRIRNGNFKGNDNIYAKVINFYRYSKEQMEQARKILKKKHYHSWWNDGWKISVSVMKVNAKEARKIKRESYGFCGYDWMIDSIILSQKILVSYEVERLEEAMSDECT